MRRLAEMLAFLALALAAHLAILAYKPLRGSDAGGSGGTAVVTLAAAPEQIDQVLREWMQAPEAETAPAEALGAFDPTRQAPPPDLHSLALDPAPRALVQVGAMAVPELPRAPAVETEPPPAKDRPETEREAAPEKTAKRAAASPSETAMQKAAGAGRTSQAGRDGPAVVKTLSSGQKAKLIAVWGAKLRSRIERKKRYPRGARGSGVVRLRIQVARSGKLLSSRVVKSSGVAAFDAAALAAIARAAPFLPAPKLLTAGSYSFALDMRFGR